MKFGIRPMQGGNCYEESLIQVQKAEELGFDSAWLTEHHGWDRSWPSPQIGLAGYATATDDIALGTCVLILPLANPIRLAGEFALLDRMASGRTILGAGLGYQHREFETFDVPLQERVTRFVDGIALLRELWSGGEVTFSGESIEVSDFELSPDPTQPGGPPIWCGGGVDAALERIARLDAEWFASWLLLTEEAIEKKRRFHEFVSQFGGDPSEKTNPIVRAVFVAPSSSEARRRARSALQPVLDAYIDRGHTIDRDGNTYSDVAELIGEGLIVGDPDEVTEQLSQFIDAYGTEHLIMEIHGTGVSHEETLQTLELLGEEVLPQLR